MPVRFYLVGIALVFILASFAGASFTYAGSRSTALTAGERDAAFSAKLAASGISSDLREFRSAVTSLADNPGVGALYAPGAPCTITFPGAGVFPSAHLELVRSNGSVACSSLGAAGTGGSYQSAPWLLTALRRPLSLAPVADPVLGGKALALTAPVPGYGMVAALFSLARVGPAVLRQDGVDSQTEFLIVNKSSSVVIARSIDQAAWIGKSLSGTRFAATSNTRVHAGLDGTTGVYGQAGIALTGWTVYAGIPETVVLASSGHLLGPAIAVLIAGLLAMVVVLMLVSRQLTRPLQRLNAGLQAAATAPLGAASVEPSGPAEVHQLARNVNGLLASVDRELTERNLAENAARTSEANYRVLFNASPHPRFVLDLKAHRILEVNAAATAALQYSRDEFLAMSNTVKLLADEGRDSAAEQLASPDGMRRAGPFGLARKDGSTLLVEVTANAVTFEGREALLVLAEDVTERDHIQRQLLQSQRLESLGELAGGIAHDFNNLLAVILNYAAFVAKSMANTSDLDEERLGRVRADVDQIQVAAERASRLTRQLLAFARREVIQPRVLDLNEIVGEMEAMLHRTIGEHISLEVSLKSDLPRIQADPGQLEQILTNLAVNARDAMPSGGVLAVETAETIVDEEYAAARTGVRPGTYVSLRVSDTGSGISRDVLGHVFEPFFSTKPKGEGTGLGLSTVHGVVSQMGGDVHIYSEPGMGTTITILIPTTDALAEPTLKTLATLPEARGERVLVVEDEVALLDLTQRILSEHGYQVLAAATAESALEAVAKSDGQIHLLLTDVVMPRMLGRELAAAVKAIVPDIAILFMSGYAQPVLASRGTLDEGVSLIDKPFTEEALLVKVREVLDAPIGASWPAQKVPVVVDQ
jgi:PAS domain S-box-containing protein